MGKTYKLETPKSGIERWNIAGDFHSFFMHRPTFNIMCEHAMLVMPNKLDRKLIINGDFLDIPYGMKKNEGFKFWKSKAHNAEEFFIPRWEEEVEVANKILDELQTVFSQIVYISGNHGCPRLDNIKSCVGKEYHYIFDLKTSLKLEERKIPLIGYNDWLDFGDLSITHSGFHGTTAWKKNYEASGGRNVVFSHVHQHQVFSFMSRGKTKQSVSLPALCELNPEYMRNNESNWTNGFGEILMKPNGHFNLNVYLVWDDQLVLSDGTILNG